MPESDVRPLDAGLIFPPEPNYCVEGDRQPCTCGKPGTFWGHCDVCGLDRWVFHRCSFPCDDVTCEDGAACLSCTTGEPCPVHDDEDYLIELNA